jgi:hypothetical protein
MNVIESYSLATNDIYASELRSAVDISMISVYVQGYNGVGHDNAASMEITNAAFGVSRQELLLNPY